MDDTTHSEENPWFRAFARFTLAHRFWFLALSLAGTLCFGWVAGTRLKIENSNEAFLASNASAVVAMDRLRDDFGQDFAFQLLVSGPVFSLPYLERLRKLHDELGAMRLELPTLGQRRGKPASAKADKPEGADPFASFGDDTGWGSESGGSIVDQIISLVNARQTSSDEGGLRVSGLLDKFPSELELPALRARVLADQTLVGQVVGADGQHSVLVVRTDFMSEEDSAKVYAELLRIGRKYEAPGFHVQVAGFPALTASISTTMLDDLGRMMALSVAGLLLLLTWTFRHPLGILGPLAVVSQAVIWTLGAMALTGVPLTVIGMILPPFLLCGGIGEAVHVQSVYRDARLAGMSNQDAIVHAVATTGVPILFTTVTTFVGLISFRWASLEAIRDMGSFGALGVAIAFVHTLCTLPVLLSFNTESTLGARGHAQERDLVDRLLDLATRASGGGAAPSVARRRRGLVWALAAVVSAGAAYGIATLQVFHDGLSWFEKGTPVRDAIDELDRTVGGTSYVALSVEANQGRSVRDRELLLRLEKLERHIRAYRSPDTGQALVGTVTSVLDVVRESHRAVNGDDPQFYRLPDTQQGVDDMFTLFEGAGSRELARLVTVDSQKALMFVRVRWLDASASRPLANYIREGIDRHVGGYASVTPTGTMFTLLTVVDSLLSDLVASFGTSFVLVALLLIVMLRSVKLGLLAMIPNLLPIAAVLGLMGLFGIPLDMANVLIASIAMGVAVDDTVHFFHEFRSNFTRHGDVERALARAFSHTGRSMVSTGFVLIAGFGVYTSATMTNVQRFGFLVALCVALAMVIELVLSPTILRTFYRSRVSCPEPARAVAAHPTELVTGDIR